MKMSELPDHRDLLARWQENDDREALEALVRQEIEALKGRIHCAGLGTASVSDIAQEAMLRALDAEARFPSLMAMRSYLWICARNLLVNRLRRSRRTHFELSRDESLSLCLDPGTTGELQDVEDADLQAALEIALNLLSPEDREVLRRVYLDDSSVEHAARTLGVSCDVVKARLVRARVRLAEKLSHWRELVSGS